MTIQLYFKRNLHPLYLFDKLLRRCMPPVSDILGGSTFSVSLSFVPRLENLRRPIVFHKLIALRNLLKFISPFFYL